MNIASRSQLSTFGIFFSAANGQAPRPPILGYGTPDGRFFVPGPDGSAPQPLVFADDFTSVRMPDRTESLLPPAIGSGPLQAGVRVGATVAFSIPDSSYFEVEVVRRDLKWLVRAWLRSDGTLKVRLAPGAPPPGEGDLTIERGGTLELAGGKLLVTQPGDRFASVLVLADAPGGTFPANGDPAGDPASGSSGAGTPPQSHTYRVAGTLERVGDVCTVRGLDGKVVGLADLDWRGSGRMDGPVGQDGSAARRRDSVGPPATGSELLAGLRPGPVTMRAQDGTPVTAFAGDEVVVSGGRTVTGEPSNAGEMAVTGAVEPRDRVAALLEASRLAALARPTLEPGSAVVGRLRTGPSPVADAGGSAPATVAASLRTESGEDDR